MTDFTTNSYSSHAGHLRLAENYKPGKAPWDGISRKRSVNYWRHLRLYSLLNPFLRSDSRWITVGDGWGWDANFLRTAGKQVMASDLSTDILAEQHRRGLIGEYSARNAEKMSCEDNAYDYVLVKEAFHHFPRPHLAVYELLRVSTRALILIEPQDPLLKSPVLLFMKNVADRFSPQLINRWWKNRFSFEITGNYVYKISDREMEKIAMGIDLPMVAFRGMHDVAIDVPEAYTEETNVTLMKKMKRKLWLRNALTRVGLLPYSQLCCVLFKKTPDADVLEAMRADGFRIVELPRNPYAH